jgi:hypothetical protein
MRLRLVDGDPQQTARVRGWLLNHPGYKLFRGRRHRCWRLSDGRREVTAHGWHELFSLLDAVIEGEYRPGGRAPVRAASQLRRQRQRPEQPDILA